MKHTIIKIFIIFFTILTINCPLCLGADIKSAEISKLENNLYGFEYNNDKLDKRISRLEVTIYGKIQNGDTQTRLDKIKKDMSSDVIGLEIPATDDSYKIADEKEDSTVEYPIVNEIEQKLFNTTHPKRDFHTRIVTIEKKLFGKIYDVNDYSTRMDRIKTALNMNTTVANNDNVQGDNIITDDIPTLSESEGGMPSGQSNYTRPYKNYGDSNFLENKNSDIEAQVAEMEYNTFGTEFSNDDLNTRIKRLNSIKKAKKSKSKYDSQKFQQHMSMAMEIGAMILMILAMVL